MTLRSMAATQASYHRYHRYHRYHAEPFAGQEESKRGSSRGVVSAPEQSVSVLVEVSVVHSSDPSDNDLSVAMQSRASTGILATDWNEEAGVWGATIRLPLSLACFLCR